MSDHYLVVDVIRVNGWLVMQERRNVREVVKVVEPEIGMNVRRFQEKVEDRWSRKRNEE